MRLAVLILLACAQIAEARSVGVVVTGEEIMQSPVRAQLEDWLHKHGHEPVASPLPSDAIGKLVDCFVMEDEACAQKLVEQQAKADAILYARVEVVAAGTSHDVTLTMYWFVKGATPRHDKRVCEGCSDEAMHKKLDDMIASLVPLEVPKVVAPPPPKVIVIAAPAPTHLWPAVALGTGVAALLAGGILYWTSETDDGSKPTYRDTRPLGIGLGIGGAAAIGVGLALFVLHAPESGPRVAVGPRGGIVGWAARF